MPTKTIIEPFRIKSVEPIRRTTPEERKKLLEAAGYNLFSVAADAILIDFHAEATSEKQAMGFTMSRWDQQLLVYGEAFEARMMSLKLHLSLEEALDEGWRILAESFEPAQTGLPGSLVEKFWPQGIGPAAGAAADAEGDAEDAGEAAAEAPG